MANHQQNLYMAFLITIHLPIQQLLQQVKAGRITRNSIQHPTHLHYQLKMSIPEMLITDIIHLVLEGNPTRCPNQAAHHTVLNPSHYIYGIEVVPAQTMRLENVVGVVLHLMIVISYFFL